MEELLCERDFFCEPFVLTIDEETMLGFLFSVVGEAAIRFETSVCHCCDSGRFMTKLIRLSASRPIFVRSHRSCSSASWGEELWPPPPLKKDLLPTPPLLFGEPVSTECWVDVASEERPLSLLFA